MLPKTVQDVIVSLNEQGSSLKMWRIYGSADSTNIVLKFSHASEKPCSDEASTPQW